MRNCLVSGWVHVTQPPSPQVFMAQSYGIFSSWYWSPGLRHPVWGWDPLLLKTGTLWPIYHSPFFFKCHTWVLGQPIPGLHPSYPSQWTFLFNSLAVGHLFSQISGGSELWLFCGAVVMLMWFWEAASTVFIYTITVAPPLWHSFLLLVMQQLNMAFPRSPFVFQCS